MTAEELIRKLKEFPPNMKVLIDFGDLGWGDVSPEDIRVQKVFTIWHSDWNNNGRPYTSYEGEPRNGVLQRRGGMVSDYVVKTLSEEDMIILR